MTKLFDRLGHVITGISFMTFALLMNIFGMTFLSHGLFYQIFSQTMEAWHATVASWTLSLAWEFAILVTTCNIRFVNSKLPGVLAVCSGLIVLFFIQAFNEIQPMLDLLARWFVGVLVATINYVYTELFYKKWKETLQYKETSIQMEELRTKFDSQVHEFTHSKSELELAKSELEQLREYVSELEDYKAREVEKLTCPYCKENGELTILETIFKLTSHKGICKHNPRRGLKESIFDKAEVR